MSAALSLPSITSILDLPDGLHEGVPEALYHQRIPGVASNSVLSKFDPPAVYEEWLRPLEEDEPTEEETKALFFGKAFHCALLEPQVYADRYVVRPKFEDCRKPANKKLRDDWEAENQGRIEIKKRDAIKIRNMIRALDAHKRARQLLRGGVAEVTIKWTDEETGLICKGRADYYNERFATCVDVKTCKNARSWAFSKSASDYGYDRQNAFYEDGFAAIGKPLESFCFIAIEKKAPYLIGLHYVTQPDIDAAREWSREQLKTMRECIEHGRYPGLTEEIQPLTIRRWTP